MNLPDFPRMDPKCRKRIIDPGMFDPEGEILIDTDTKNEIDDQFALTYALLSDRLKVGAIYAAQFSHKGGPDPAEGMEQSYREIRTILELLKLRQEPPVFKGNTRPLEREFLEAGSNPPVEQSEAVKDLIARARAAEEYLPVVSIGAATNIGAALLAAPDIAAKLLLIWLGGNEYHHPKTAEYNLMGDLTASRLIYYSGIALIRFPAQEVTSKMSLGKAEVLENIAPLGEIGTFLTNIFLEYVEAKGKEEKEIWDMATVAVLENPGFGSWEMLPMPELSETPQWIWGKEGSDRNKPDHCVITDIDSEAIFSALYRRMKKK